jgi:hypothetical protein
MALWAATVHENSIFVLKILDCVIGRGRITTQPHPSGLAKNLILKTML